MFFIQKEKKEKTITMKRLLMLFLKHQTYRDRDMKPYQVHMDLKRSNPNSGSICQVENYVFDGKKKETFFEQFLKLKEKLSNENFCRLFSVHFQQKNLAPIVIFLQVGWCKINTPFFTHVYGEQKNHITKDQKGMLHTLSFGIKRKSNDNGKCENVCSQPVKVTFKIYFDQYTGKFYKMVDIPQWIKLKDKKSDLYKEANKLLTKLQAKQFIKNIIFGNERDVKEFFLDLDLMFKGKKPELDPIEVKVPNEIEFAKLIFEGSLAIEDKLSFWEYFSKKVSSKDQKTIDQQLIDALVKRIDLSQSNSSKIEIFHQCMRNKKFLKKMIHRKFVKKTLYSKLKMFKGKKPELDPIKVKVPNEIKFAKLIFDSSLAIKDKLIFWEYFSSPEYRDEYQKDDKYQKKIDQQLIDALVKHIGSLTGDNAKIEIFRQCMQNKKCVDKTFYNRLYNILKETFENVPLIKKLIYLLLWVNSVNSFGCDLPNKNDVLKYFFYTLGYDFNKNRDKYIKESRDKYIKEMLIGLAEHSELRQVILCDFMKSSKNFLQQLFSEYACEVNKVLGDKPFDNEEKLSDLLNYLEKNTLLTQDALSKLEKYSKFLSKQNRKNFEKSSKKVDKHRNSPQKKQKPKSKFCRIM